MLFEKKEKEKHSIACLATTEISSSFFYGFIASPFRPIEVIYFQFSLNVFFLPLRRGILSTRNVWIALIFTDTIAKMC